LVKLSGRDEDFSRCPDIDEEQVLLICRDALPSLLEAVRCLEQSIKDKH
jgi:hypothetical protein